MKRHCIPVAVAVAALFGWGVVARGGADKRPTQATSAPGGLDAKQLADLWDRLGGKDASKGDAAVGKLIWGRDPAAAFLARKFTQAAPDRKRIAGLIADLDADDYRKRESASAALRKAGRSAMAALRKELKVSKSLEVRTRIRELLDEFDRRYRDHAETRRYSRAVKVLEAIGSIEALRAAKALADVAPSHAAGEEANDAVSNIADGLARSLVLAARASSQAGRAAEAVKLCRQALAFADDAGGTRKKSIQAIVDALAARRNQKPTDKMWQQGTVPSGPQTPRAAVLAMVKALERRDGKAFAACFDARADQKDALKEMGAAMGKVRAFQRAGIKAYGKEAWKNAGGSVGIFNIPSADEIARKTKVKAEGDRATCTMPWGKEPLKLLRKGGKWLIEPGELIPPKARRAEMLKMLKLMADAVDEPMKKIGRPGVTAKQVREEFFKAMMKAMMKTMRDGEAPDNS